MVSLTRKAAEKVRLMNKGKKYIRVVANGDMEDKTNTGYRLEFTDNVDKDDILYMSFGIKVLVGSDTRKYFENLKIDFVGTNGSGKFDFKVSEIFAPEY